MTKTKLQIMREKKGLTAKELAIKVLNGHPEHVDMISAAIILHENRMIDLGKEDLLDKYAQALGCPVDELVEEI
ncbi:helix-turn-helix domain-containing protein [Lactococcus petauri]|uniref:helix-turn-helix domain-containing protein n=1 Tax=Lactococcus petauri TaxID=1940789 RepID=UPI0018AA23D8|nr:helix-turn-helix transcriptional regulator [Lactococcus petauri]MDC0825463.1 helix-turn-helix transcriptional regulator [Lactococcus petauri]